MGEPIKLLVLGTRSFASEIADVASEVPGVEVAGFVENMDEERSKQSLDGLPVHWVDDIGEMVDSHLAISGLATTQRSLFTDQVSRLGMRFATVVHPTARVSHTVELGEGTLINAGVIIGAHTKLGNHVIVNRGALIGHHTEVGDFVTIHPGANVAGACWIGEHTYIGMGAVVIDHTKVGTHSVVGAGAVVVKEVPDRVQVVGVPAKIVKRDILGK